MPERREHKTLSHRRPRSWPVISPLDHISRSINDRLNRYRGLGRRVADRQTLDEIKLIQQLEAQKLAVHSIR